MVFIEEVLSRLNRNVDLCDILFHPVFGFVLLHNMTLYQHLCVLLLCHLNLTPCMSSACLIID